MNEVNVLIVEVGIADIDGVEGAGSDSSLPEDGDDNVDPDDTCSMIGDEHADDRINELLTEHHVGPLAELAAIESGDRRELPIRQ